MNGYSTTLNYLISEKLILEQIISYAENTCCKYSQGKCISIHCYQLICFTMRKTKGIADYHDMITTKHIS